MGAGPHQRGTLEAGHSFASVSAIGSSRTSDTVAATLTADLEALASQGFTPALLARLVNAVATEREHLERPIARLELVATGLEAQAQARDTLVVVEQLFTEAKESVLVVGFAVYQGNEVFKTLAKRMMELPQLQVVCCFDVARGTDDRRPDAVVVDEYARRFVKYQWPGTRLPEIYFDRRSLSTERQTRAVLHAKTIVVDHCSAILTSANPTPAAYLRNIELGIVLTGGEIPLEIENYFRKLISEGRLAAFTIVIAPSGYRTTVRDRCRWVLPSMVDQSQRLIVADHLSAPYKAWHSHRLPSYATLKLVPLREQSSGGRKEALLPA